MDINELAQKAHKNAVDKGFWDQELSFSDQIANMHSELSEAFEEYRDYRGKREIYYNDEGKPSGIPIEFADTILRILDSCVYYGIDLEQAIELKMKYNLNREYKHGKKI